MEQPIIKHVFGNLMRIAIPLTIRIRTMVDGHEQETEEDFYPDTNFPVAVRFKNQYGITREFSATMEGNVATASDEGTLQIGIYNVEVVCRGTDGHPYRFMVRQKVQVVDATIDAGIESGIEFDAQTYTIEGAVFFYAKGDKGEKGDRGERGEQGEQGIQGERGEKGDTGFCFFAIFEVDSNGDLWMTHNPLDEVVLEVEDGYLYQMYNT